MRVRTVIYLLFILSSVAQAEDLVLFAGRRIPASEAASIRKAKTVQADEFGTGSDIIYNLNASEFQVRDGAFSNHFLNDLTGVEPADGTSTVPIAGPVRLPSGALLTSVTMYYYDSSPAVNLSAGLWRVGPTGNADLIADISPGGSSGWANATFTIPNNSLATVDNDAYHYEVLVILQKNALIPAETTRLLRVAIKYRRQISPAPATATFTDVPTSHPLFQFIEALAASGITAGCSVSPPQYCPDAPLTRAQMAVFLSRGLGLHWAP